MEHQAQARGWQGDMTPSQEQGGAQLRSSNASLQVGPEDPP